MNNSNELLLLSLKDFYSRDVNIQKFLTIINGSSKISLRLIDWFITNHCKNTRDVVLQLECSKQGVNIYQNYRSQLKAYKKIKFDPFRRRQRIIFYYGESDEEYLNTTIGQLNFFKWAIEYEILDYITDNEEYLEDCMNTFQKKVKSDKKTVCKLHLVKEETEKESIIKVNRLKIKSNYSSFVSFD